MKNNKIKRISETGSADIILEIGAEGGSLKLQRFRAPDGTWKFNLIINESTLADFLDEADQIDLAKEYTPVDTFEEAIQVMNNYPWRELELINVFPEYAEFIQSEMHNPQIFQRRKSMNAQGPLTSAVAGFIKEELNKKGFDVYYDHKKDGKLAGTIAVSFEGKTKGKLGREEEISQLDIAVVERNFRQGGSLRKAMALVEIEETTDNPKKLIGDIFAVLMGKSIYLPGGEEVAVGKWTTLIIIAKEAGHKNRNDYIQNMANDTKSPLGSANLNIGNIVIDSFSPDKSLEKVLMNKINEAI